MICDIYIYMICDICIYIYMIYIYIYVIYVIYIYMIYIYIILCYIYIWLYNIIYVCEYIHNSCIIHSISMFIHRSCKCLQNHGTSPDRLSPATANSGVQLSAGDRASTWCSMSTRTCVENGLSKYKPKAIPSIPSSGLSWYIMIYHDPGLEIHVPM